MDGMAPTSSSANDTMMLNTDDMMMMRHMSFFMGKNAEILFSGWPGNHSGMYALALIFVFVLSLLVEWLSHYCSPTTDGSNRVTTRLFRTFVYAHRVGLAYMVMLAVMSFNVGVLIVAVAGHTVGFFLFGSGAFKKAAPMPSDGKTSGSDVPPMNC